MMRRATFLISALCLLILANVLMIAFGSPAFHSTGEGFVAHMMDKKQKKETDGFRNFSGNPAGAKAVYTPMGPFDGVKLDTGHPGNPDSGWRYTKPNEPLNGPEVEMGPDSLFMFKNNQCKPECCGASFSCNGGCVCTSPQQRKMINERGGNRTISGDF